MELKKVIPIVVVLALFIAGLACGSSDGADQQVRTLIEPGAGDTQEDGEVVEPGEPTSVPPTNTPRPTATPEIQGLIKEGTHLVGIDIEPGIYVGLAGEGILESCYWERLKDLTGELEAIIANNNSVGLYYIEILESDMAFETACELLPIEVVPVPDSFITALAPGTYLIGRDIEAGLYRGETGTDFIDSCYWERSSCVLGELECTIANDNATGQFFIQVEPTDYALSVGCEVAKVDQ
jgi:hypothetical protein